MQPNRSFGDDNSSTGYTPNIIGSHGFDRKVIKCHCEFPVTVRMSKTAKVYVSTSLLPQKIGKRTTSVLYNHIILSNIDYIHELVLIK